MLCAEGDVESKQIGVQVYECVACGRQQHLECCRVPEDHWSLGACHCESRQWVYRGKRQELPHKYGNGSRCIDIPKESADPLPGFNPMQGFDLRKKGAPLRDMQSEFDSKYKLLLGFEWRTLFSFIPPRRMQACKPPVTKWHGLLPLPEPPAPVLSQLPPPDFANNDSPVCAPSNTPCTSSVTALVADPVNALGTAPGTNSDINVPSPAPTPVTDGIVAVEVENGGVADVCVVEEAPVLLELAKEPVLGLLVAQADFRKRVVNQIRIESQHDMRLAVVLWRPSDAELTVPPYIETTKLQGLQGGSMGPQSQKEPPRREVARVFCVLWWVSVCVDGIKATCSTAATQIKLCDLVLLDDSGGFCSFVQAVCWSVAQFYWTQALNMG